ncbi:hypothetical protein ABT063_25970 [Streptomyces sp. NPDC002838]|uniref:DedA family protein n=1 Tax=Streptomyces sp. NPDC002838 TaxID=3154436 RepID=UPI003328BEBC
MQIEVVGFSLGPEVVAAVALLAVIGDAFLPFLPSGSLVIAASLLFLGHGTGWLALLLLAVAAASFLGDLLLIALVRSGSSRADALLARHAAVASATRWFQSALADRLGGAALAGRFVPAGRTVLGVTLGAVPGLRARYLRWSAVGGLLWACYLVGLAVLNGAWFETRWIGFAVSAVATFALSTCMAWRVRRQAGTAQEPGESSPVGHIEHEPVRVSAGPMPEAGPRLHRMPHGPCHRQRPRRTHPITGQDTAGGDPPRIAPTTATARPRHIVRGCLRPAQEPDHCFLVPQRTAPFSQGRRPETRDGRREGRQREHGPAPRQNDRGHNGRCPRPAPWSVRCAPAT